MYKNIIALAIIFSLNASALEVKTDQPYKVKKGDTLWDISEHFLNDPWEWEKIWASNKYIENPNLIYPDDVIKIRYVNGNPEIIIENKKIKSLSLNDGVAEVKKILTDSIPSVDRKMIEEFNEQIFLTDQVIKSKVITSYTDKILHYKGDKIIVSLDGKYKSGDVLSVLNFESDLKSDELSNIKVYEVIAKIEILEKHGNLFIAEIISNKKDVKSGDVIVRSEVLNIESKIFPSKPPKDIEGSIVYNYDRINTYKNKIVILDKGYSKKIKEGDIVSIEGNEKKVKVDNETYQVDGLNKGFVFIYKVERDFSYGIIVKNKELIKLGDKFKYPF